METIFLVPFLSSSFHFNPPQPPPPPPTPDILFIVSVGGLSRSDLSPLTFLFSGQVECVSRHALQLRYYFKGLRCAWRDARVNKILHSVACQIDIIDEWRTPWGFYSSGINFLSRTGGSCVVWFTQLCSCQSLPPYLPLSLSLSLSGRINVSRERLTMSLYRNLIGHYYSTRGFQLVSFPSRLSPSSFSLRI